MIDSFILAIMIGLACGASSLLLGKSGPWQIFDKFRKIFGTPMQCNICRPAWLCVAIWSVMWPFVDWWVLLGLPSSWGVAYVVTSFNGVLEWD